MGDCAAKWRFDVMTMDLNLVAERKKKMNFNWTMIIIITLLMNEKKSNQNNFEELEMLDITSIGVVDTISSTSSATPTTDNTTINNGLERIKVEIDLRIIKRRQIYLELVPPVISGFIPTRGGRHCVLHKSIHTY